METTNTFINIRDLVAELIDKSAQGKKIAFSFCGGGARGAYHAGVIEALQQEVNRQQQTIPREDRFVPDIICATSAGSLAGFAYWVECLLPSTPTPDACRQTQIWRDLANGNRGAEQLFTNPNVVGLLTHSSPDLEDFLLSLDNLKEDRSKICDDISKLMDDLKQMFHDLSTFNTSNLKTSISNAGADLRNMRNDMQTLNTEKLKNDSSKYGNDLHKTADDLRMIDTSHLNNKISENSNKIKEKIDALGTVPKLKDAGGWLKNAGGLIVDIRNLIGDIITDLGQISFDEVREFVNNVGRLKNDVGNIANNILNITVQELQQFTQNVINFKNHVGDIGASLEKIVDNEWHQFLENSIAVEKDLSDSSSDLFDGAKQIIDLFRKFPTMYVSILLTIHETKDHIKKYSSLMRTDGLERKFEEFIINSYAASNTNPMPFANGEIQGAALDQALIKTVNNRIEQGKKTPELFITGTDITANRAVIFSVATPQTTEAIADKKTWIIKLHDDSSIQFKRRISGNNFIFEATQFEEESTHTVTVNVPGRSFELSSAEATDVTFITGQDIETPPMRSTRSFEVSGAEATDVTFITGQDIETPLTTGSNRSFSSTEVIFNQFPSVVQGHSKIIGAILTSASIPLVFPPRLWQFVAADGQTVYKHWFVDGGIVTNRPVDIAVKAGADIIISFELSPLLGMTSEMVKDGGERPKAMNVFLNSMTETTLNAWFHRYFEEFVEANQLLDEPTTVYRFAPMMYATPVRISDWEYLHDESIGPFHFNGRYDDYGNLKMNLFDWFMKGYMDAYGGDINAYGTNADYPNDPVLEAYYGLPGDFGATKNAQDGRRSGFYNATKQAHPTQGPSWNS